MQKCVRLCAWLPQLPRGWWLGNRLFACPHPVAHPMQKRTFDDRDGGRGGDRGGRGGGFRGGRGGSFRGRGPTVHGADGGRFSDEKPPSRDDNDCRLFVGNLDTRITE